MQVPSYRTAQIMTDMLGGADAKGCMQFVTIKPGPPVHDPRNSPKAIVFILPPLLADLIVWHFC